MDGLSSKYSVISLTCSHRAAAVTTHTDDAVCVCTCTLWGLIWVPVYFTCKWFKVYLSLALSSVIPRFVQLQRELERGWSLCLRRPWRHQTLPVRNKPASTSFYIHAVWVKANQTYIICSDVHWGQLSINAQRLQILHHSHHVYTLSSVSEGCSDCSSGWNWHLTRRQRHLFEPPVTLDQNSKLKTCFCQTGPGQRKETKSMNVSSSALHYKKCHSYHLHKDLFYRKKPSTVSYLCHTCMQIVAISELNLRRPIKCVHVRALAVLSRVLKSSLWVLQTSRTAFSVFIQLFPKLA